MGSDWKIELYEVQLSDLPLNKKIQLTFYNFPDGMDSYVYKGSSNDTNYLIFKARLHDTIKINDRNVTGIVKLTLPYSTLNKAWKQSLSHIDVTGECQDIRMVMMKVNRKGKLEILKTEVEDAS